MEVEKGIRLRIKDEIEELNAMNLQRLQPISPEIAPSVRSQSRSGGHGCQRKREGRFRRAPVTPTFRQEVNKTRRESGARGKFAMHITELVCRIFRLRTLFYSRHREATSG